MGIYCNCVKITSEEKVFFILLIIFQEEFSFIENNTKREAFLRSIQKNNLIELNENLEKKEEDSNITSNDINKIKIEEMKNSQKNSVILFDKPVRKNYIN